MGKPLVYQFFIVFKAKSNFKTQRVFRVTSLRQMSCGWMCIELQCMTTCCCKQRKDYFLCKKETFLKKMCRIAVWLFIGHIQQNRME